MGSHPTLENLAKIPLCCAPTSVLQLLFQWLAHVVLVQGALVWTTVPVDSPQFSLHHFVTSEGLH